MSLIKCMECGKEYSARAHSCPNCGCPTWDTINKLYQEEQVVNICHKMYDVSEIVSNIKNNINDQVSVELLSNMTGFSCGEVAYIFIEIKEGNFLPWDTNEYGDLTNPKHQEKINRKNEQIARQRENIPHCPNCNSTNIKRITTGSRMLSGLTFGILSSNIGKTYQCNNCKYKW